MRFFAKTKIDFLGKRKYWYIFSSTMVLIGLFSVFVKGLNFGIDFQGGTELIFSFKDKVEIGDIRTALTKVGLGKSEIKTYGLENNVLIRTAEQTENTGIADEIKNAIKSSFPDKQFEVVKEDKIGPKIGSELRRDALYALIWSFIAILVYVAIRFKLAYGMGAVIALVHDVVATLGFLAILGAVYPAMSIDISLDVIAALLTIIGVSVNDTVVIFDRIRENEKIYRSLPLYDVINLSINDTLSRTIITNGTVFAVLVVLMFFGGEVLRGLVVTLFFGSISGTYSTIYVASAFVHDYTKFQNRRKTVAVSPVQQ